VERHVGEKDRVISTYVIQLLRCPVAFSPVILIPAVPLDPHPLRGGHCFLPYLFHAGNLGWGVTIYNLKSFAIQLKMDMGIGQPWKDAQSVEINLRGLGGTKFRMSSSEPAARMQP
jgi:hypothetical protein